MAMTGVPATDTGYNNTVQCLRKRITWNHPGTTVAMTVGKIPAGAIVVGGGVQIITAFDGGGTDLLDIGTSDDPNAYQTIVSLASKGYIVLDELASADDYSDTAEVTITATYTDQNGNASAGIADVVVFYITRPVT